MVRIFLAIQKNKKIVLKKVKKLQKLIIEVPKKNKVKQKKTKGVLSCRKPKNVHRENTKK